MITDGVVPSLHVDCKNARIKQYHKQGRALRTETTINNTRDFGIGKLLKNLPALRQLGFQANRRLAGQTRFLDALQRFARFALLYQHPAFLQENAGERNASDLIAASSKIQTVLSTLHVIRGRREKVIIFACHRTMQAIFAEVLNRPAGASAHDRCRKRPAGGQRLSLPAADLGWMHAKHLGDLGGPLVALDGLNGHLAFRLGG